MNFCFHFKSFRFIADLQSMSLFGMKTNAQSRPLLASGVSKSTIPLIHVELEFSPMDSRSDYRLNLVIEPLKIAYDAVSEND
jgi:hypothetical protein